MEQLAEDPEVVGALEVVSIALYSNISLTIHIVVFSFINYWLDLVNKIYFNSSNERHFWCRSVHQRVELFVQGLAFLIIIIC